MFGCDHRKLILLFNDFHCFEIKDLPEHGEFCLLELKDGRHTAGAWYPRTGEGQDRIAGEFIRGLADTVPWDEVAKWHHLKGYNLSGCLEEEDTTSIRFAEEEDVYTVKLEGFGSTEDGELPKKGQYCLLVLQDGSLSAGRWRKWRAEPGGTFVHSSGGCNIDMKKVWAWTALSSDCFFEREEERENERRREEELNRNPSVDEKLLRYGLDIDAYYEKARDILRKKYPWATVNQMKRREPWEIVPFHGRYVFGQTTEGYDDAKLVSEWQEGSNAEEFIAFLCAYTEEKVKNSDPEKKFRYGRDIGVYLKKAYENVKKQYRWVEMSMVKSRCRYEITQVDGEWEFVRGYGINGPIVCEHGSAESFIGELESEFRSAALDANPAVAEYEVPFGHIDLHGWVLEKYSISKLKTGDYKVNVQAGNRSTGGGREFFITPYCFEAENYSDFLDRYLEIVPGESFGLFKEDLLPNKELKKFFGY